MQGLRNKPKVLREARRLAKGLLCEDTAIVLDTSTGNVQDLMSAVQQILGKSSAAPKASSPAPAARPVAEVPEEQQVAGRSGKWNFKIHRDSAGSITSIEAEQL